MKKLVYFIFALGLCLSQELEAQTWRPLNGAKETNDNFQAFVHANIYTAENKLLTDATILIKEGKIIAVGSDVILPGNTVIHDLQGKFIYPSFIELHSSLGINRVLEKSDNRNPQLETSKQGPFYWNEAIHPETNSLDYYQYDKAKSDKMRSMGFGTVLSHVQDGLIRGTSFLSSLNETPEAVLMAEAAMHYSFSKGSSKQSYPTSLMGAIALIRQVQYDAQWYAQNKEKTSFVESLEVLNTNLTRPLFFDAGNSQSILRAKKIADEFALNFVIKGTGQEYEMAAELKEKNIQLIVPVDFPKPYDVKDPVLALELPLAKMKEWELAPYNLGILSKKEIPFAITSDGIDSEKEFYSNLEKAIKCGVSREVVLNSLTQFPAKILKIDDKMGSLAPGKLANFLIFSDTIFKSETMLLENWVAGKKYDINSPSEIDLEGNYSLTIDKKQQFDLEVKRKGQGFTVQLNRKNETEKISGKIELIAQRLSINFIDKELGLIELAGSVNDKKSRIWSGLALDKGNWSEWAAVKRSETSKKEQVDSSATVKADSNLKAVQPKIFYPNMAYGWDSVPTTPKNIVFRNATIWTNEKDGILRNHDVFIRNGKIELIGAKLDLKVLLPKMTETVTEIDLKGKHLTSGIIDEHSHIAISRGVNESGQAITAEVSIGDVIDGSDINIYRQLAGGVTTSQLLHGSANPIGGQSAIIKLRWGLSPEKMKMENAPKFIKFALGENVKQSNWGDRNTVRFPQTRMGVEQVFFDGFYRAKQYKDNKAIYNAKSKKEKKTDSPNRVDLELEVLAEILDSQRFITCHSYVQSEINMLIHVADSMKFRVNTFTHVLEGYKVADKIREHGAGASTFSDWWAYKFEVNDAIPYNGALLHQNGVLTGFNSDDAEMGRRLNQEAAKSIKYGGLTEEEAWKLVTLNPAKMLHIDDRVGSIKVGKDADLVVWNDNPLSIYVQVEQSYIDGIVYFDIARNKELMERNKLERERLIDMMLKEGLKGGPTQKVKKEKKILYECDTLEEL